MDNLYNNQQEILYGNNRPKIYKPTLTDLTKYLIALELILEYGGKSEKYDEQDTQHFFSYLPFVDDYDNNNVKGCCLNLIGDFLMLARTGFKEYEFDYTKRKVEELKSEALKYNRLLAKQPMERKMSCITFFNAIKHISLFRLERC
ncbi:MAG: hypothetical protein R2831_05085 [Chitinophagaceae bacterium]